MVNVTEKTFTAKWTEFNNDLKPPENNDEHLIYRITNFAIEVILYIPKAVGCTLARCLVFPASCDLTWHIVFFKSFGTFFDSPLVKINRLFENFWHNDTWESYSEREFHAQRLDMAPWFNIGHQGSKQVKKSYDLEKLTLTTPDNQTIHGHHFKHKDAEKDMKNAKVFIMFNGNAACYKLSPGISNYMDAANVDPSKAPCSFLSVDPRGVFNSTGTSTSDGLKLDADTLYQYAIDQGYSAENVIVVGQSLGGGMAVDLAARHQSIGTLIADRTFSKLEDVAADMASNFYIPQCISRPLLKQLGWEFNNIDRFEKVKAKAVVLNHKDDRVIPRVHSLARAILQRIEDGDLTQHKHNIVTDEMQGRSYNAHNIPLDYLSIPVAGKDLEFSTLLSEEVLA